MTLLSTSIQASGLIFVIVILRRAAGHSLPKSSFLVLWAAVLARMLIPFSFFSKWSVYSILALPLSFRPARTAITEPAPLLSSASSLLIAIWCSGMIVLALIFGVWIVYSRQRLRFSVPIAEYPAIAAWTPARKIHRTIAIHQSDRISVPMAIGVFRPRILLPSRMDLNDQQTLSYVLTHEFFHIYRLDALWKLLALCALCIHWFNPMAWVMVYFLNRDLEITCDEMVLNHFGWKPADRRGYGYSLIQLAETSSGFSPLHNGFSKKPLEERIENILKAKKTSFIRGLFAGILISGILLVFITVPDVAAAQPDSQSNLLSQENSASSHLLSVLDTVRDYERSLYSEARQQERLELYFLLTQEHPSTDFPNEAYTTLNK